MNRRLGLLNLAVAATVAGVLGWVYRDAPVMQRLVAPLKSAAGLAAGAVPSSIGGAMPSSSSKTAPATANGGALRKCLLDGKPVYTNEACPAGSREQALSGGSLSVLPAAPAPPKVAGEGDAPVGNVRDLLLKPGAPGEPDLKSKRIDAIVNNP